MAVKNFVFRETWVDSKVAGMKATFFAIIFDPTWTHILAPKGPNKLFFKQYFSQERQKLYYYQFCDFKTDKLKWNSWKLSVFFPFLTQIGQKFAPKRPSNVLFLAIFALNFYSGICTTTTFCFKMYSPCKIWKNPIDNTRFFTFFTILGQQIWPKFYPKTTHTLIFFFAGFQWNILGDSINTNDFNWNPLVLKKIC